MLGINIRYYLSRLSDHALFNTGKCRESIHQVAERSNDHTALLIAYNLSLAHIDTSSWVSMNSESSVLHNLGPLHGDI